MLVRLIGSSLAIFGFGSFFGCHSACHKYCERNYGPPQTQPAAYAPAAPAYCPSPVYGAAAYTAAPYCPAPAPVACPPGCTPVR